MGAGCFAQTSQTDRGTPERQIQDVVSHEQVATTAEISTGTFDDLSKGGCVISKTEARAITLLQLRQVFKHIERRCVTEQWVDRLGNLLTPDKVTLYDTATHVIKPATLTRQCSLVELMATGPQRPAWFVSHWWGEPVGCFLRCLEQHAADHGLDSHTAYWVCAYANNQHHVASDVTADPAESSFVKAIELAGGRVLTVLDEAGETYARVWCILEISYGLKGFYEMYTAKEGCKAYDATKLEAAVAAATEACEGDSIPTADKVREHLPILKDRRAVGITDGPCGRWGDGHSGADAGSDDFQTFRQAAFPVALIERAFQVRVQDARASLEVDRTHILNYIIGRRGEDLKLPPVGDHELYDETNRRLHGIFVAAGWRLLLESGADMQMCADRLQQSGCHKLGLSFDSCPAFTDAVAKHLADSLPVTLEEVRLHLAGSRATEAAGRLLLDSVGARLRLGALQVLWLADCMLTGTIPEWLGHCTALRELQLNRNPGLTGPIPDVLGACTALRVLGLGRNNLTGSIPAALGCCTGLEELYLHNNQFTGSIPTALNNCTSLKVLTLHNNSLTGSHLPTELRERQRAGLLEVQHDIDTEGC